MGKGYSEHQFIAWDASDGQLLMHTFAIIEESQAVKELRDLHERAERSAQEIGEELLLWKERLPLGKFAEAYREAGWASSEVDYYLYRVLKPKLVDEVVTDNISNEVVTDKSVPHVAHNSGNNEWYTPAKYIEAARKVMGEIDIDPATSPYAQGTVQAKEFYTKEINGLDKPWNGRVWLNPPYSGDLIWPFIEKLMNELEEGRATEAIVLTNNATDTAWFHKAEELAAAICFTRGRVQFVMESGESGSPLQGQAFFYFGENISAFRSWFSEFGFIR